MTVVAGFWDSLGEVSAEHFTPLVGSLHRKLPVGAGILITQQLRWSQARRGPFIGTA